MNKLLYRLLSRHINAGQLAGFVLANLCGMTIVLAAIQFATDIIPMFTGSDSFMKPGQMVMAKHVSTVRTLTGKAPTFTTEEIDNVRQQSFVSDVGTFTPSLFSVVATLGSQRLGVQFSTDMFFEAVPDAFIDVDLSHWKWEEGDEEVPIILPRNYLNLYNFGFASSQGLPALSEGLVSMVKIHFILRGTAERRELSGRVVAFSKKLNTILVPQHFMDVMNATLSPDRQPEPSRLIVTVSNPADEQLSDYLEKNGYETEADDAEAAKTAHFLRIIISIVLVIGLIISVLAFYVLLLSIFLLLQKNTQKIDNLLLIGYSPTAVARPYHLLTISLNTLVLVFSIILVLILRNYYLPLFGQLYPSFSADSMTPTLLTGLALYALISLLNFLAIRQKVTQVWHIHEH
ncbi:MAG: ABC transporter permease [Prevotella sp.]|nr:ABC transporter permease [Prevotella sp.]